MEKFQHEIMSRILDGGFKPGELTIMMAGRNHGKSQLAAYHRLFNDIFRERPVEDLIFTESRLHGARYYCVEPVGGNWKEMEMWATETFGKPGEVWPENDFDWPEQMRWAMNNRKFWFRNEKDRNWFTIRWNR